MGLLNSNKLWINILTSLIIIIIISGFVYLKYKEYQFWKYSDLLIIIAIFLESLILGVIKFQSLSKSYENSSWQLKFIEWWNDFMNFFISGLIACYYIFTGDRCFFKAKF